MQNTVQKIRHKYNISACLYCLHTYQPERRDILIVYTPFWSTLKDSQETTYTLINRHHISSSTIDKLRKNKPVTTTTLNDLCRILNVGLDSIAEYVPSDEDQIL